MSARWLPLALASLALAVVFGCSDSKGPDTRPNVLILTLDTLRADRVGCYGYASARTPNLDALAARGVRFERAYSHTPFTLPSHSTIMTGLHPTAHGLHINFQGVITGEATMLAEVFKKQGYDTAAFVAASVLDRRFGLDRGFGVYDDLHDRPLDAASQVERPGSEVADKAIAWLDKLGPKPFFGWVHFYDAHDPYLPPEGFRDFKEPYDGEVAYVDSQVGRVFAALERLGKAANTYIVVVGDHGEAFGEHGEEGHGLLIYDSTMHVPMIFAGPAEIRSGTVVRDPVGLVDVHPTLEALLAIPATKGVEGQSLAGALRGEKFTARPLQIESENPLRAYGWAPLYGLIAGKWKYIRAPEEELFDLIADPREERNLCGAEVNACSSLAKELARLRASGTRRAAGAVHLGLDSRNALTSLGYVEGADVGDPNALTGLADPKKMVHVCVETTRARGLLRIGKIQEALEIVRQLVVLSPQSGHLWMVKGTAEMDAHLPLDAIQSFESSLKSFPNSAERVRLLGDALAEAGRSDEALARYKEALALDPLDGQNESRLGNYYARAGNFDEALVHFKRFVELEPNSPNAHTNLANALLAQSKFDEATEHLERALKIDRQCAPAYHALYTVRRHRHDRAGAIEVLRRAGTAFPRDASFHMQLAWMLATTRSSSAEGVNEAVQLARACVQAGPTDPAPLDVLGIALARHGDFAEAIEVSNSAVTRARAAGNATLATAIEARVALYQKSQAFLEDN